jgi:hypothetical protein
MKVIISTGDRASDLFLWAEKKKTVTEKLVIFDGTNKNDIQKFTTTLESISLFEEVQSIVIHNIELTAELISMIGSYAGDIYIVSLAGKFDMKKLPPTITTVTAKIADSSLKEKLAQLLRKNGITLDRITLMQLTAHISIDDGYGKSAISPAQLEILERRVTALKLEYGDNTSDLVKDLVSMTKEKVSQWDLLKKLFSSDKKSQLRYFAQLTQQMSLFEIIAIAKTSLFLVLTITNAHADHLDNTTIATKLKKNLFYIESLYRTAQEVGATKEKLFGLITRLMNLELAIKSGKFDDEQFGFDILLATI